MQTWNQWGPALLVCLAVLVGTIYSNVRIGDLQTAFHRELDLLRELIKSEAASIRTELRTEIKRLEDKIDRIGSPIARP